jgi:hypothetical protein
MVDVMAAPVALVAVNAGVFPDPLAASPIAVLEFVQEKVAPAGVLLNADAATVVPLQIEIFDRGLTMGKGLTVMIPVPE